MSRKDTKVIRKEYYLEGFALMINTKRLLVTHSILNSNFNY